MPTRHRRRSRFPGAVLPLLLVALTAYFAWQGSRGTFGSDARQRLAAEREAKTSELAALTARREALLVKVRRLRSGELDGDLLDERARDKLGFARPSDIIILHDVDGRVRDVARLAPR